MYLKTMLDWSWRSIVNHNAQYHLYNSKKLQSRDGKSEFKYQIIGFLILRKPFNTSLLGLVNCESD